MEKQQNNARHECSDAKYTPFIKLIRTPRAYYFFDVNRNSVWPIDELDYSILKKWLTKGTIPKPDEDTHLQNLIERGWLSWRRPSKLENPTIGYIEEKAKHDISTLVLQITQACNLTCIYCPFALNKNNTLSRTHTNKMMSFATAKKAIDFLLEHSDSTEEVSISFYGGEPLIAFSLMCQCVEYADRVFDGKKVMYSITTNATLLTDEIIDYCAVHAFNMTFSVDGPKPVHDRHRCRADGSPTYDLVMQTLQKTVTRYQQEPKGKRGMLMINAVINPEDSFDDVLDWLGEDVLSHVLVQASLVEDYNLERKFAVTADFATRFRYHLALSIMKYLNIVPELKTNSITDATLRKSIEAYGRMQGVSGELSGISSPGGPCISGISKLFVNVDGNFYPCEKVNEESPCMVIGNIDQGFDLEQIKKHLNIAKLTEKRCRNCWAQVHCNICQKQADGGEALSGEVKNKYCQSVYDNVTAMLRMYVLFYECRISYRKTCVK